MLRTIVTRLALLPIVLFALSAILFTISQVVPSDPATLIIPTTTLPPQVVKTIDAKYGLDRPIVDQYGLYLDRLAHGDLGTSIRYDEPVSTLLKSALPATLTLVLLGNLVSIVVGVPLGFMAARYRDRWVDTLIRSIAMIGVSVPSFYLAIVAIYVFAFRLGWFPISGRGMPPDIAHLILPVLVLAYGNIGHFVRVLRASLLDEMTEDHIRAARARGLGEGAILLKLAGRNSLGPTLTVVGLNAASLAAQVILIESVFGWPGIGNLIQFAIQWNDLPLIVGSLIVVLTWSIVITLLVDIAFFVIDPRLRSAALKG